MESSVRLKQVCLNIHIIFPELSALDMLLPCDALMQKKFRRVTIFIQRKTIIQFTFPTGLSNYIYGLPY